MHHRVKINYFKKSLPKDLDIQQIMVIEGIQVVTPGNWGLTIPDPNRSWQSVQGIAKHVACGICSVNRAWKGK